MGSVNIPRNGLCYLDGRPSTERGRRRHVERRRPPLDWSWLRGSMTHVSSAHTGLPADGQSARTGRAEPAEGRWLAWGRPAFAVVIVLVLIALGIANIQMRARWHEVEDGVLWSER